MMITKNDGLIIMAISVVVGLFGLFSTDKAWIHTGNPEICGIYCRMAMNYGDMLFDQSFDRKFLQKSMGSLLVFLSSPIFDLKTPLQINYALEVIGKLFLVGSALYFYQIGKITRTNRLVFYTLFICLFINQTFIKLEPFTQESPDHAAFFLGMAASYYFLKNKYHALLILFLIASLIQPQTRLLIIPLIIFCGVTSPDPIKENDKQRKKNYFYLFFVALLIFSICGYFLPLIKHPNHGIENTIFNLMPINIFLAALAVCIVLYKVQSIEFFKQGIIIFLSDKNIRTRCINIAIIFILSFGVALFFAQGEVLSKGSTFKGIIYYSYSVVYHILESPLKSWIVHLSFFGPLPLIFLLKTSSLSRFKSDLGLTLTLSIVIIFSLDSESRHLIGFMPWVASLFMKNRYTFSFPVSAIIISLTLIASRFYGSYNEATPQHDIYLFTWGPWMTIDNYILTAIIVGCSCLILFFVHRFYPVKNVIQ